HKNDLTRILGNVKIDFDLTEHLTLSGSGGGDILTSRNYDFLPVFDRGVYQRTEGDVSEGSSRQINTVVDATLTYSNIFSEKHDIEGMVGWSFQQFQNKQHTINASGTKNNNLDQLSNQSTFNANGSEVTTGLLSQFARLNYNYDKRY